MAWYLEVTALYFNESGKRNEKILSMICKNAIAEDGVWNKWKKKKKNQSNLLSTNGFISRRVGDCRKRKTFAPKQSF